MVLGTAPEVRECAETRPSRSYPTRRDADMGDRTTTTTAVAALTATPPAGLLVRGHVRH